MDFNGFFFDNNLLDYGSEQAVSSLDIKDFPVLFEVAYQRLKQLIKTDLHKTICDEQEEFWRHKVYLLLNEISDSNFFKGPGPSGENITPKSAAVMYAFSQWKEDSFDPLSSFSLEQIVAEYGLFSPMYQHFRDYIEEKFPGLTKKIRDYPKQGSPS